MSNQIYQSVTDTIIAELEKGAAPWVKPWRADNSADRNITTGKPYQGINRLLFGLSSMARGYSSPYWASYDQWQTLGGQVRKGEKGTQGVFFKPVVSRKDKATGEESVYTLLKPFWVFNLAQVDGITITPPATDTAPFNAIETAEATIAATGAVITHGGDAAFYAPTLDRIQLPNQSAFANEASYYATAFHELGHWTGAKHRLDRNLSAGRFGNPSYAFEELVAEITAAYLCADHQIQGELRHAGYIGHWLKACREDNKAIFKAAALAQKAADYINAGSSAVAQAA